MKKTAKGVKKKRPTPRDGLDRPFCGGTWTSARYFQFIRTALRQASNRWKPKYDCLKQAETKKKINKLTGKLAMHFTCALCRQEHPRSQVNVDHIIPAGSLNSFDELGGFAQRLFCEVDGLRVLCHQCHDSVTVTPSKNASNNSLETPDLFHLP